MPFINQATGQEVAPSIATDATGALRPGFAAIPGDGEYVGFDMAFMDSASSAGRVTLRDNADPHAWARATRDAARGAAYSDYMPHIIGDADHPTPITAATAIDGVNDDGRAARDAIRAAQYR